jgi:UDP:flavonoid glycosyltransferase YjiC (YdhE family)
VVAILMACELGGGLGHVRRMLPLARDLAGHGHHPVFALPNPAEVGPVLAPEGYPVVLCPSLPRSPEPHRSRVATSFGDILGLIGLGDREELPRVLVDWERTLDRVRPSLIVCEGSPFLCLAARARPAPVVVLGYGFLLPPDHLEPFTALVPGAPRLFVEEELMANVARVQRGRGCPAPARLGELLAGTRRFMNGLPEIDPYLAERRDPVVGPPPTGVRRAIEDGTDDVFAYLAGNGRVTPAVLRALALSGLRGSVYVRRGSSQLAALVAGSNIDWLDGPGLMPERLARARLVVHHASMLTTEESLIAGRAQVVAPLYLEHLLTTRALLERGLAAAILPTTGTDEMIATMRAAASGGPIAKAAHAFAATYEERLDARVWVGVRDTVLSLI